MNLFMRMGYRVSNAANENRAAAVLYAVAFGAVCSGADELHDLVAGVALLAMLVPLTRRHKVARPKVPIAQVIVCCGLLLQAPAEGAEAPRRPGAAPQLAGVGALCAGLGAAAVVTGGGFIIYKIARFCSRKFGPATNAPARSNDLCSAVCVPWDQSCPPGLADADWSGPAVHLSIHGEAGVPGLSIRRTEADGQGQEWEVWLQSLGLDPRPGQSWARNGQPILEEDSPIQWFAGGVEILGDGGPTELLHVQRSRDLSTWEDVVTLLLPVGMQWEVQDSSVWSQVYYRVIQ